MAWENTNIQYKKTKESIISYLEGQIYPNVDNLMYLKWCKDVYILNHNTISAFFSLKQNAIYWINMGYGVGSEIRKIRPAILWRKTKDSAMCTIIPLTSKNYDDKLYFHYDLKNTIDSTAKIEYLTNISTKRILSPYYSKNKMTFISNEDREKIILIIEQYYLFKNLTKADKKQ